VLPRQHSSERGRSSHRSLCIAAVRRANGSPDSRSPRSNCVTAVVRHSHGSERRSDSAAARAPYIICEQDAGSRVTQYTPPHPRPHRRSTPGSAWFHALPTATSRAWHEIACSSQSTRMEERVGRLRPGEARPGGRRSTRDARIACPGRHLPQVPKSSKR